MPLGRTVAYSLLTDWIRKGLYAFLSTGVPGNIVTVPVFSPAWFLNQSNCVVRGSQLVYVKEPGTENLGEMEQASENGTGVYLVFATLDNKLLCYGKLKTPIRCTSDTYIMLRNGTVLIDLDVN